MLSRFSRIPRLLRGRMRSAMCSYNLTNSRRDCENGTLLNQVLKSDWGFPGFVISGWWATHCTASAANNVPSQVNAVVEACIPAKTPTNGITPGSPWLEQFGE